MAGWGGAGFDRMAGPTVLHLLPVGGDAPVFARRRARSRRSTTLDGRQEPFLVPLRRGGNRGERTASEALRSGAAHLKREYSARRTPLRSEREWPGGIAPVPTGWRAPPCSTCSRLVLAPVFARRRARSRRSTTWMGVREPFLVPRLFAARVPRNRRPLPAFPENRRLLPAFPEPPPGACLPRDRLRSARSRAALPRPPALLVSRLRALVVVSPPPGRPAPRPYRR